MSGAQVIFTDLRGSIHRPAHLLSMDCTHSWETPASGMALSFPCEEALPQMHSVRLLSGDKELFYGLVDKQTLRRDKGGMRAAFSARGMAAAALDNEAQPRVYGKVNMSELFTRHLRPHGFTQLEGGGNTYLRGYTVAKGMSDWEAFSAFCRMSVSKKPYVKGSSVLLGTPPTKTHTLTEGSGILALEHALDRYGVLSEIWLRNQQGLYSSVLSNPQAQALRVQRRRYLIPDTGWAKLPGAAANERIRASMLEHSIVKLTLAGLRDIAVGERAALSDKLVSGHWFVREVRHSISASGLLTGLVLCDEQYL